MPSPIGILQDAIDQHRRVQHIASSDLKIRWTHVVDYRIQDNRLVVVLDEIDLTRTNLHVTSHGAQESVPEPDPNSRDPNTQIVLGTGDSSLLTIFNHV